MTGALSLVGQVVPGWVIGRAALILAGRVGRLALFQVIGWVPGDYLAYVDGVAGIQMFEMVRSEFLANPATGGGLADAAGYDERIRLLDGWHR